MKVSAAANCLQKILVSNKKLIVYIFMGIMIMGCLWRSWQYLFITQQYTLTLDSLCSEKTHTDIQKYAQEYVLKTMFDAHTISNLKSQFAFLGTVHAHYVSPGHVHIALKTLQPIIRINDTHVLLENGALAAITIFHEDIIKELPTMLVAQTEKIDSPHFAFRLKQWLDQCSTELFAHYTIRWIDHTNIQLHDKELPNFCIITHYTKNPSYPCANQCLYIKNQLVAQHAFKTSKEQKRWGVDIRFKNQFIVHRLHEGVA